MKFGRNLTAAEIVDQALHFRRIEAVDHCVFMGMGEPMMNLDTVLDACAALPDIGITHRRTAISTVGWIPGIERLTESEMPIRLALSLHAPNDALRSELMPVNDRYPLADVLAACRALPPQAQADGVRRVRDAGGRQRPPALAKEMAKVLDPRVFKVNLIPYNPTGSFDGSEPGTIRAFRASSSAAACAPRSGSPGAGTSTPPAASSRRVRRQAETSDARLSLRSRWRRTSDPPGGPPLPHACLAAEPGPPTHRRGNGYRRRAGSGDRGGHRACA